MPNWNPISISGYHIREAGATAVQELAFTFANAIEYVARAIDAGLAVDAFAPRLSFFFAAHNDLFEEVAKFRAARRIYARLMRDRFGASDASARLRFHTQTGGVTLQAQQPLNNVVRVTVQALAAVLGGTQSLHTNGYDEALALPTAEAATLALRTQQIVALRDRARRSRPIRSRAATTSSTSRTSSSAARSRCSRGSTSWAARRKAIEAGSSRRRSRAARTSISCASSAARRSIVGVNAFADGDEPPLGFRRPTSGARAGAGRAPRQDEGGARSGRGIARRSLRSEPRARPTTRTSRARLMPLIIDAVRARASVGEIADTLAAAWGTYRPAR